MPVQHVQLLQVLVILLPTLMQNHSDGGRVSLSIESLSPRAPQDFDSCRVHREREGSPETHWYRTNLTSS